jgi:hypothetical protein
MRIRARCDDGVPVPARRNNVTPKHDDTRPAGTVGSAPAGLDEGRRARLTSDRSLDEEHLVMARARSMRRRSYGENR